MKIRVISLIITAAAVAAVAYGRPELVISEDQRGLIYMGSFGFLAGGTLEMDLQDLKVTPYEGDTNEEKRIGFLIQKGSSDAEVVDWEDGCILDDPYFKDELDQKRSEFLQLDTTNPVFQYRHTIAPGEEEMWNMLFVNCPSSIVSFRLKITEINPGNNYLSAGDIPLPKVYAGSAVAYFIASGIWLYMLTRRDTRVFWPHKLIFILAVMIGIQKTFQAIKVHYMQIGVDAEGWTVMFYIFAFLKGSLSILIITLIASGWMFIKPFLSQKDKKIILVIIPLQILSNIASTVSNETAVGSINWSFWTQVFPMVDLVSCVVILGVIIQTQRHLSEAAEVEGKVAESKSKYKLWGSFYLVTVIYIYLTRILIEFLKVALPYQYVQWLVELLNEAITLGFYATIGWKFRPYANNPYTLIDEDDHDHDNDIELGANDGETNGFQTMSRREGRMGEHDD
ncbi:lung seven transmembrane receptor-domain-containing protein [Lobosporangium transversale]|uniref:Lung seven transmembrane receptor-domain-containing protein n=1 Tax=Lobosporangium transversale TaxID=64571 RepID=A0A1Y2GXV7_9FUNG|nr:lung seven transmembrane receptor-domain-containing protein [Lobosporangium transversale]ORZ27130.1 lung seven transmembrane receptor-domain-containing protein [Lobosporangium transversale]|eukprot:XP_021884877.1 lung seven transmembrane receptor-domain-containing protein [Lobosporangium transversale]